MTLVMVDSSVWIDYFNGVENTQTDKLNDLLGVCPVAAGDLILTEVLQGFRHDRDFKMAKSLFEELTVFNLVGKTMALKSAHNFRTLRNQGITIRKPIDAIIATFCIENNLPLLFTDKDFKPFVDVMGLVAA